MEFYVICVENDTDNPKINFIGQATKLDFQWGIN